MTWVDLTWLDFDLDSWRCALSCLDLTLCGVCCGLELSWLDFVWCVLWTILTWIVLTWLELTWLDLISFDLTWLDFDEETNEEEDWRMTKKNENPTKRMWGTRTPLKGCGELGACFWEKVPELPRSRIGDLTSLGLTWLVFTWHILTWLLLAWLDLSWPEYI